MSVNEASEGRLDAFLAPRGITRAMLLAAVGEPYGRPLLVVATGSILHGYGNERSDIDINVVVDHEVTQLPIQLFSQSVLLDTVYFSASEVANWASTIKGEPWPLPGRLDRKQWRQRTSDIFRCTRLGYSLLLSAQEGWDRRIAEFREAWLAERVSGWWRIESVRMRLGARWLAEAKPLLAAQRQFEAVVAALESRAAAAGHPHSGPKWLAEKLRILGDNEGHDVLVEVMRAPVTAQEAQDYVVRCEALLSTLTGIEVVRSEGLAAQLWYLPGVKVRRLDARTLVSRWHLRGLELRGAEGIPEPPELVWEGGLDVLPPDDVLALFIEDMTWLSIVTRTA